MTIAISKRARNDIVEGSIFYETQREGLGDEFRHYIGQQIARLHDLAAIHSRQHGYFHFVLRRFPFIVYYDIADEVIQVVAVLDGRQNPLTTLDALKHRKPNS